MQSLILSREEKLPLGEVIYAIPNKVRWDGWWLTPTVMGFYPPSFPRHASVCWHPRLSIGDATVCRESTARQP